MGSIHAGLLSGQSTSGKSMLLSVKVSHWMFLGFPSSEELANLDRASACQFSECGMCTIEKCFSSPVASRTRRTYAAIMSSFTSYVPLS